jgi:hypothetical protein
MTGEADESGMPTPDHCFARMEELLETGFRWGNLEARRSYLQAAELYARILAGYASRPTEPWSTS